MSKYFSMKIPGALLLLYSILGNCLVARRLNSTLPVPMQSIATYYDGESDFIFLVGGDNGSSYLNSILRFDISTDKIEQIGSLPNPSWKSPVVADSSGNLVYFESFNFPREIFKFDIVDNSLKAVGELNVFPAKSASISISAGRVLLLGGKLGTRIWEFNLDAETVQGKVVGEINEVFSSAAAVTVANNTALVFGYGGNVPYFELDLETMEIKEPALSNFPGFHHGMTVTGGQNHVYCFRGQFSVEGIPVQGIIQLDPTTHSWEFVGVQEFPYPSGFFHTAPEVVWVQKLSRIYMFGGCWLESGHITRLNDIYYIDVNPISPEKTPVTKNIEVSKTTSPDQELFFRDDNSDGMIKSIQYPNVFFLVSCVIILHYLH